MPPQISLITVSFNSEKTIERTLKSILSQTFSDFEYIIVDGGSTDTTNEIITKYKNLFKGRLTHISEPDNGIYDAMNKGIAMAKGELLGLLNSDDYYYESTLAMVNKAYMATDLTTVISGELIFKSGDQEQRLRTSADRFKRKMSQFKNGVRHPATFVPRKIYEAVGGFNLDYKIASDAELMFRISKANFDFKFINTPLLVMCDGGISNSRGNYKQLLFENKMLLNTYCSNPIKRFYFLTLAVCRLVLKESTANLIAKYRQFENK